MDVSRFPGAGACIASGVAIMLLAFSAPHSRAQDPGEPRWTVIAECQMVVLPQKAVLPLMADLSDDAKIETAFAQVQKMIAKDEATLVANLVARGDSNQELKAQSVEEFRYPTEYDPPQLPYEIPKDQNVVEFLKAWPAVGITPTAFENRPIGATLDLRAAVSPDGQWIAAEVTPQHVRFLRNLEYIAGILPNGMQLHVDQPLFSTLKNTTNLQMRAGQRILLGMHKLSTPENTMELFFLRIRTQISGKVP